MTIDPDGYMAFSPDGTLLAIGEENGVIDLRYVEGGKPVGSDLKGHTDQITGLSFSPDGKVLASSSRDRTIRIWNIAQPGTLPVELDGHASWVSGVAFSPDGRTLVSTSLDGTTRLWDSRNYLAIGQLTGASIEQSFSPIFSSDGKQLIAGGTKVMDLSTLDLEDAYSDRGLVLEWKFSLSDWKNTACSIVNRNFSLAEWHSNFGAEPYRKTCQMLPLHPSVVEKFLQTELPKIASGGMQSALDDYVQNMPIDPALAGELETSFQAFPIFDVVADIALRTTTGEIEPAVEMYQALLSMGTAKTIPAYTWNHVCYLGSLWGKADQVLDICELAVSLDPTNGGIRDSRGIAMALTGNTTQAIQDFQAFIDYAGDNQDMAADVQQRRDWITALQKGENPFTEALLKSLRERIKIE